MRWTIFDGDIGFPFAVLKESAIVHNSRTMIDFCERHEATRHRRSPIALLATTMY
jgi:hypothetical protein